MFGLDKISLNNTLEVTTTGENIYNPYISGFALKAYLTDHATDQTAFGYLQIKLNEFSSNVETQLRGVYIKGQIRSLNPSSKNTACFFEHTLMIRRNNNQPIHDFSFQPASSNTQLLSIYGTPPNIRTGFLTINGGDVFYDASTTIASFIMEASCEITSNEDNVHYLSGIYYVI